MKMNIRAAEESDQSEIVKLLKISLREDNLPLSEEIWKFKHFDNPFGRSFVFIAEEDNQIIGVRAYMRWEWQKQNKKFSAFRAVDTATHPRHQRNGIFKMLNLRALEEAKKAGVDFIFNTPNKKSRPGNLKMGWSPVNKINVGLKIPLNSFYKISDAEPLSEISVTLANDQIEDLCAEWNKNRENSGKIFTPKSRKFLKWRYENNFVQKYEVVACKGFYMAVYVKERKGMKELRISECIHRGRFEDADILEHEMKKLIKKYLPQIVSYSPSLLSLGFPTISGNFGPLLMVKPLNLEQEFEKQILEIGNWNNSIGDLELF